MMINPYINIDAVKRWWIKKNTEKIKSNAFRVCKYCGKKLPSNDKRQEYCSKLCAIKSGRGNINDCRF